MSLEQSTARVHTVFVKPEKSWTLIELLDSPKI